MSRDGLLPDNVSEADFDRAYPTDCPDSCRSMQVVYSECGGIGQCECRNRGVQRGLFGLLRMWFTAGQWWAGDCLIDPSPECDCHSPAEIRADREEARAEAREDR